MQEGATLKPSFQKLFTRQNQAGRVDTTMAGQRGSGRILARRYGYESTSRTASEARLYPSSVKAELRAHRIFLKPLVSRLVSRDGSSLLKNG